MTAIIIAVGIFLSGAVLSAASVFLVRRFVGVSRLRLNNEIASCYLAIVMGLYGIFSGFIIASLWEQQRHAEENVLHEASELRTIFRLAGTLPGPTGPSVQQAAIDYAKAVVDKEWELLLRGDDRINSSHPEKDRIWESLKAYVERGEPESPFFQSLLSHFETLSEARRSRVYDAQRSLPAYLWMILIMGSGLSILCTLLLGTENIRLQALLTGLAGGLVLLMLFVVQDLQNPFQGYWVTTPQAFELALDRMSHARPRDAPSVAPR